MRFLSLLQQHCIHDMATAALYISHCTHCKVLFFFSQHLSIFKLTNQLVTFQPLISWVRWPSYREEDTPSRAGRQTWDYLSSSDKLPTSCIWHPWTSARTHTHAHTPLWSSLSVVSCLLLQYTQSSWGCFCNRRLMRITKQNQQSLSARLFRCI